MVLTEGRAIAPNDTENICVINSTLAEINGLKIGDKITVDLYDKLLPQHSEMGATAVIPERRGNVTTTAELEIIGLYTDIDPKYMREQWVWWGYSPNTIFVPQTLLPIAIPADHNIYPGEYSVVVSNAFDIKTFHKEADSLVRNMSIRHSFRFSDKGWLAIADNVNMGRTMSLMTTAFFLLACALAFILAVYLYIARERRNFAIMRALGVPQKQSRNSLALPLILIAAISIITGAIVGIFYADNAVKSAVTNFANLAPDYILDSSLPTANLLICLIAVTAFITLISALFLHKLAKISVLDLLQGNKKVKSLSNNRACADCRADFSSDKAKIFVMLCALRKFLTQYDGKSADKMCANYCWICSKLKPNKFQAEFTAENIKTITEFSLPTMPQLNAEPAALHVAKYVTKHVHRSKLKSAIAVVLAVLLTGACGFLSLIKLQYAEIFEQLEVKGSLSNFSSENITEARNSALMNNLYYSGGFSVIANGELTETAYLLSVTNDFDRLLTEKSEAEYEVSYGENFFKFNESNLVIIGIALAFEQGLEVGDNITLLSRERALIMRDIFSDDEVFYAEIASGEIEFTVAGIVTSDDRNIAMGIFAPISDSVEKISAVESPFAIEYAEFTLIDKENYQPFLTYIDTLAAREKLYTGDAILHINFAELDNIKQMRDMLTSLFPIALSAAVIIGLAVPLLIISQSAKEAAIMRILGTTKRRARAILATEQFALCLLGIILAAIALAIYDSELFLRSTGTLLLCGGLYFAACILSAATAAVLITKRRALDLLQVKE
ncbi:MAG: FtsX-like permease family protein [Oscillospiraceae bacterium]|nr:FtsX-like permease family protein [Oscillospiraceae bacterium]